MLQPITTQTGGDICFAFPDVCDTPVGTSTVPIPYPNVGDLGDADGVAEDVFVGGDPVVLEGSEIPMTTGDEAGSVGGVNNEQKIKGKVEFDESNFSDRDVYVNGEPVVCMFDDTEQNDGNAHGVVLGGDPTVLVGGG